MASFSSIPTVCGCAALLTCFLLTTSRASDNSELERFTTCQWGEDDDARELQGIENSDELEVQESEVQEIEDSDKRELQEPEDNGEPVLQSLRFEDRTPANAGGEYKSFYAEEPGSPQKVFGYLVRSIEIFSYDGIESITTRLRAADHKAVAKAIVRRFPNGRMEQAAEWTNTSFAGFSRQAIELSDGETLSVLVKRRPSGGVLIRCELSRRWD